MTTRRQAKSYIAWYRRSQWDQLRRVCADPSKLAATWDEWHASVQETVNELKAHGLQLGKVIVDVDALVAWCKLQGRPVDSAAAAAYASEQAVRGHSLDW